MQTRKISMLLILVCILSFSFHTIVFSALQTTTSVTGTAYARVEADVRITDFQIFSTAESAISSHEEFNKDAISSTITLPNESSQITYLIEITNYGSTDVGINNISNLPDNLSYSLTDYTLKDKICDTDNKCNTMAVKTFYLTIYYETYDSENITYNLNIDLDFQMFYQITYNNLDASTFPTEVLGTNDLSITLTEETLPQKIEVTGTTEEVVTYQDGQLIITNITNDLEITPIYYVYEYDYTGDVQVFTAPCQGTYKIELWGAQGGYGMYNPSKGGYKYGGYGAYVTGLIELSTVEPLYIYVGGQGGQYSGGYNGGGDGSYSRVDEYSGGGGGATHIAISDLGVLANYEDFVPELIAVAGGGGGGSTCSSMNTDIIIGGGSGGGMNGGANYQGTALGATQTEAGTYTSGTGYEGSFGQGGNGYHNGATSCETSGGGGGGLYGGIANTNGGSGGSGYIASTRLTDKYMICYNCDTSDEEDTKTITTTESSSTATEDLPKEGAGYVRITYLGY